MVLSIKSAVNFMVNISGLFIYTCGAVIIIEDLDSGKQSFLMGKNQKCTSQFFLQFFFTMKLNEKLEVWILSAGHTEEISTVAIQNDSQVMIGKLRYHTEI